MNEYKIKTIQKNKGTAHILLFQSVLSSLEFLIAEFRMHVRTTKCNNLFNTKSLIDKLSKLLLFTKNRKKKKKIRFVISMIVYA